MPGNTGTYNIRYPIDSDDFSAQSIRNMAEDIDAAIGLFNNQTYQTLSLMNGWQSGAGGQPKICKMGGIAVFTAEIYKTTAVSAMEQFCAVIPAALRPMHRVRTSAIYTTADTAAETNYGFVDILTTGICQIGRTLPRSSTPGYHIQVAWITV